MLNCKWSEKAGNCNCCGARQTLKHSKWDKCAAAEGRREKETESKADKEREPLKVVSCLLGVFSAENFTVDPLRERRLIRTYKILYWFSLYARYLPLPLCECVCECLCVPKVFQHRTLATSFNRFARPSCGSCACFYCWCKIDLFAISFPLVSFYF